MKIKLLLVFLMLAMTSLAQAGITTGPNTGGVNPTGSGVSLTNILDRSIVTGPAYSSTINTNVIVATGFGTASVNGVYQFSNNLAGISYYTNGSGLFIGFDMGGGPYGYIGSNGQSEGAGTFIYEAGLTVFSTPAPNDVMYGVSSLTLDGGGGWDNQGTFFTTTGANPVGITIWGQAYAQTAATALYTNQDIYVSPNGNDHPTNTGYFATWASMTNALLYAALNPGTTIHVLAGVYNLPQVMVVPTGTTIIGEGVENTRLILATNNATGEPHIVFGNNTVMKDLYYRASTYITGISNSFYGVWGNGIVDGLIYYNGTWDKFYAKDSSFSSGYDACVTAIAGNSTITNMTADFYNCQIFSDGTFVNNGEDGSGVVRGLSVERGRFNIYGGSIKALNNAIGSTIPAHNVCINISGTGAQVFVSGVHFECTATNGTTNIVLYPAGATTNCVFEYDNCIPNLRTNDVYGGVIQMLGGVNATNVFGNFNSLRVTNLTANHFSGLTNVPPTIVTNAGAGAGIINATATLDATANDAAMAITVTAGTTPSTSATIFTVTFGTPYLNNNPPHVVFCPGNSAAALLSGTTMVFVGTTTTNGFTFSSGTAALTASIAYKWQVMVIQ